MASISPALRRIKQDLQPFLSEETIRQACGEVGYRWRHRLFDPVARLHPFILQIINFNTAITHLRHLSKAPINAASYCKARMRLPLAVVQRLLESSAQAMAGGRGARRLWHGLQVYLTDGSGSIAPRHPGTAEEVPPAQEPEERLRVSSGEDPGTL